MLGNTVLVEHGIQTEQSNIRAHVCPKAKRIYVYPTWRGVDVIKSGGYRYVDAHQPGVIVTTAKGYLVPPFDIRDCVSISVNNGVWEWLAFSDDDSLRDRGRKATQLVLQMIKRGLFPIPAIGTEITDKDIQISGTDILIRSGAITQQDIIIQVKCDYPGGERELGGTGNLFLQIAECNPQRIY